MAAGSFTRVDPRFGAASNADQSAWFSTLTYRSKAVQEPSELELYRLLRSAQQRNRAEGVTGLLVYDHGHYLQWLEGPADNLARVWHSVARDPRHTAVEVLGDQQTPVRFFADWDLKLLNRSARRKNPPLGSFDVPEELIDALWRQPEVAPSLLARLAILAPALPAAAEAGIEPSVLLDVIETVVIPRLKAKHALRAGALTAELPLALPAGAPVAPPLVLPVSHPRVAELAHLLIAADPRAAADLVSELYARASDFAPLSASLFEPAARSLGDLWQADDCSEFEVTLGLGRLRSSIRRVGAGMPSPAPAGLPAVLVVPQPGESHLLGAALDSEMLWRAGWDMHSEFPATDAALEALLAGTWFDALDLSLSAAFRREHWLPRLAATIAHARSASRNPALVVVVGGRVFGEPGGHHGGDPGMSVGADGSHASSVQVEALILTALRSLRR